MDKEKRIELLKEAGYYIRKAKVEYEKAREKLMDAGFGVIRIDMNELEVLFRSWNSDSMPEVFEELNIPVTNKAPSGRPLYSAEFDGYKILQFEMEEIVK